MSCEPSPVAKAAWQSAVALWNGRIAYLGIVGDNSHRTRKSDHNCGQYAGYESNYAHALDIGIGGDVDLGWHIFNTALADSRVKYAIFRGQGQRAHHRGGTTFQASGHSDHVHLSFMPGTTFSTEPFFGAQGVQSPSAPVSSGDAGSGWIPSPAYWDGVIREGMSSRIGGDGVEHVQGLLAQWGYPIGPVDGLAGPKFTESVRAFQSDAGISVDGQVGNETRGQLEDRHYSRGRWAAPAVPPFPGGLIRRGHKGEAVRQVQQRLADRGWSIEVDGDFGPKTEKIVRQFQAEKGLSADGVIGSLTWNALWLAPVT